MIAQIKTFDTNVLAIEVFDGFTEEDEKICQKLFNEKIDEGFKKVNVLIKLDEAKMSQSSTKAFFEDMVWALRNYKKMGHIAIVAHSNVIKALVPIDNLFFKRAGEGSYERYFDVSQLEEAFMFVNSSV
ncbi:MULTISPECIES: STAS/SEC14 domain-containing protein [Galbibacter]|uniref:STAS/SEC14 domain-containing protein n=1 Tax=Galbibacter pacificus TaxID=2996052 RepID=A0ABT6FRK5_9FLAO|nr:STAS/SEC14 domain-containing protein [Galbibacter pacificus]MDG3582980.1 STAS/SEC14 domain-containing protein [Galbibacter pacificus]MDG3585901.1 STAS/SEC14 domain-containing protein [Galbibacter pacificus]